MASALYDFGRESFLGIASGSVNWTNDVIKACLISSSYVVDLVNHRFVNPSLTNHTCSLTPQVLASKTTNSNGTAGAANVTFLAVPAPYTIIAVGLYKESGNGSPALSQLIAYIDSTSITGLPLTGSGADITVAWNTGANKIFKL